MSLGGRHPPHLRHNPIYIAAKLPLRVPASETHEEIAESQQVNWAEGRRAGGHPSKLVYRLDVGQIGRNRAQPPLVVTVGDPILAPMAAPADEIELAARLRMKGVGDTDPAVGRTHTISSRQCGARPRLKSACRSSGAGSWHDCGIAASSRWPSSMPRSGHCSTN